MKGRHALHRHPNAEEWEHVISSEGIKNVGEEAFLMLPGELAFIKKQVDLDGSL